MNPQYAGDVGDAVKFWLLRKLRDGRELGVNMYIPGSPGLFGYLDKPERNELHALLKETDPALIKALGKLRKAAQNTSWMTKQWEAVLPEVRLYTAPVPAAEREQWSKTAAERLEDATIVFLDPDIGIYRRNGKFDDISDRRYVLFSELLHYEGRSLVVYQQHSRMQSEPYLESLSRALNKEFIGAGSGKRLIGAVVARYGSTRSFLFIAEKGHRKDLLDFLDCLGKSLEEAVAKGRRPEIWLPKTSLCPVTSSPPRLRAYSFARPFPARH